MSRVPVLHGGVLGERQLERVLWTPLSVFVTSARLTVLVSFSAHRYNIISDCLSDYLYQCCADVCHFVRFVQRYIHVRGCGLWCQDLRDGAHLLWYVQYMCHIALHHDLLLQMCDWLENFWFCLRGLDMYNCHVDTGKFELTWHLEIFWSLVLFPDHTHLLCKATVVVVWQLP